MMMDALVPPQRDLATGVVDDAMSAERHRAQAGVIWIEVWEPWEPPSHMARTHNSAVGLFTRVQHTAATRMEPIYVGSLGPGTPHAQPVPVEGRETQKAAPRSAGPPNLP